jgi:sulfonate transport system permease protein
MARPRQISAVMAPALRRAAPRLALVSLAETRPVRARRRNRAGEKAVNASLPWLLPLALLVLWQVTTSVGWLAPQILPSPAAVGATFIDLVTGGDIIEGLAISLRRIAVGFACGAVTGLAAGIALGRSAKVEQYFGPSLRAIAQVPSLGWLPFLMLIFGLGETLNYVIIAKACFIPIAINTSAGIRNLQVSHLEMARALRLRRSTMMWRVVIPGALPSVFSGVRLALSHAWIAMVVVEMLADTTGIGYLMTWGRTLFQIDVVIVGMILIGVIGYAMDRGLRHIERRLQRWRPA